MTEDMMATTVQQSSESKLDNETDAAGAQTLALGMVFGIIFGFLLQKGGVAKFNVLISQLLLQDFTVLKVMLSAVVVGMIGIHLLHRAGKVQLHIKPTRYASNILGGLLFGAGFALSAYCPGTGAAAVGQGNYDAIAMMVGMVGGSYLFAECSSWIGRKIDPIGDRGKLTLHDWLPINRTTLVVASAIVLCVVLAVVETLTVR